MSTGAGGVGSTDNQRAAGAGWLLGKAASALHVALAYAEGTLHTSEADRSAELDGCFEVLDMLRAVTNPPASPLYLAPAVPVVQPEPGERAEKWAAALNLLHTRGYRGTLHRRAMALADAEVAAAVAAVRADTLETVDGLMLPDVRPGDGDGFGHAWNAALKAAAELLRGSS